jgi:Tol biopolymer transport system component
MFLPGIVSGHYHHHSTIVFSPDGNEACWTEMYPPREKGYGTGGVMTMKVVNGKWTIPQKSKKMRGEPFFSPDGKRLYFISRKPLPGKKKGGKENIWYMEKDGSDWSDPVPVDDAINSMELHWSFSLDKKGNLYFADWNRIYYAENDGGKFKQPVDISVKYKNPTLRGFCPFISPDGDYLLFSSTKEKGGRTIDLYISFRKKDGSWTDRINLGETVNGTNRNIGAFVSVDGKYMFFTSAGKDRPWGIYWLDAKIIEKLKPEELK